MSKAEAEGELFDVKKEWPTRLARLLRMRAGIETTGMTRPPRDSVKREFLEKTGQQGPYVECSSRKMRSR